jgi:DNA repair protein RadD
MLVTLRPYQTRGVENLRAAYRRGKRAPVYVLPTGGGKTIVFCYIAESASARQKRVWVLVHRQELLGQASRSLEAIGVRHGIIAPGYSVTHSPVQVASVHTLTRRFGRVPHEPDLIIIDEAHHAIAGTWRKIIAQYPNAALLGVTATPIRLDGAGLGIECGGVFDSMVMGPSVQELTQQGFLVPAKVYAPPSQLNLEGVRSRGGDFEHTEMTRRVDRPQITGDAVEHYRRLCNGKPAIAFCASVAHADHVAEQFQRAGFRSVRLDGMMTDLERRTAVEGLARGQLQVLTSCDLVSEGFDCPAVTAAILLRPTKSLSLYLQQVGRALRPMPGKESAVILDHVGNVMRHGLPDEQHPWTLDGEPPVEAKDGEGDELSVRQCPSCYAVHEWADTCPHCGHEYVVVGRTIQQVEGTLTELTPAQVEALRRMRRAEVKEALTAEALEAIARKRGYKPQWVKHVLNARQQRRRNPFGRSFD